MLLQGKAKEAGGSAAAFQAFPVQWRGGRGGGRWAGAEGAEGAKTQGPPQGRRTLLHNLS